MRRDHPAFDDENLPFPLDAAVQSTIEEPVPEDSLERVKARAKRIGQTSTVAPAQAVRLRRVGWRASRVLVGGLALAAALLIMATGISQIWDRSGGQVFAQAIEKVKNAGSVRFTTVTRFGRRPEIDGQMYVQNNRMRFEQFDGMLVLIEDLAHKQAVVLDLARKRAQTTEIDSHAVRDFENPIDQLRRAKSDEAESVGEEMLNGRLAHVYRLPNASLFGMKGIANMMVWVDAESGLPARIVLSDPDPKAAVEIRFEHFVWNEPMEARLFSLNVPAGFQPGTVLLTPRSSQPTEIEVASLRIVGGVLHDRVPAQIAWGPAGKTITVLMRDPESVSPTERMQNELRQWDVELGQLRWSQTVAGAGYMAATSDGKFLATVIGDEVQLRDALSGEVVRSWIAGESLSPLAFSPDGKMLAAGVAEWGPHGGRGGKVSGGIQFWDVAHSRLVRSTEDDKPVTFIRYSTDGRYLASSSNDGPVKVWDAATGKLIRVFPGRLAADFSPDGKTIACVSAMASPAKTIGKVDLYRIADGSLEESFSSENGMSASWLLCVAFSPDGRSLAATDWNGTVTIWDVETGERKQTKIDYSAGVLVAAFAPDSATLAIGSEDKILRLQEFSAEANKPERERR